MIYTDFIYQVELITRNGYPVENFTVQTSDGYFLDLIRIPHGIRNWNQHQSQQGLFSGEENGQKNRNSDSSHSDDSDSDESSQSQNGNK